MSAEGSVYQRKDGRWVAKWKDAHGKWRYSYYKTKTGAKQALRQALKDRDEGISPSKITISAYLNSWLEDMQDVVSKRTWLNHESIIRVHLEPTIGTKKLALLSPDDVRGLYRSKLRSGIKPSRVRRIHVTLSRALKDAVRSRYIRTNPATLVTPPQETQREINVLSPEQVKKLLAAARGDRLECAYVLAAVVGLRLSEVCGVRWEDINLDEGTLRIKRSVWRNKAQPTKNKSSRRTLKLPIIAIDALQRHYHERDDSGWLLPTKYGNPVDPTNIHYPWKRMLRRARLPETTRYHDLRGSTGSFLLAQGVPLPVVSRYLGHSNSSITLRYYIGVIDGTSGMAAQGIDDVLG
jgi:integrase